MEAITEQGGTLILSCRTGMKNQHGHLWESLLQQPIWPLIGAEVDYYDQLLLGVNGKSVMDKTEYKWDVWADKLIPQQHAEVLATHADQLYKGSALVMRNKLGKGRVYYIGAKVRVASWKKPCFAKPLQPPALPCSICRNLFIKYGGMDLMWWSTILLSFIR
ncbi:MAG TPA: beta-galactosidase trimerization domain-containing protein [Phnomibacter sp.]|nr:beta-galactosidase trimerization domain-containing protein [Phnomibacter sp.]